MESDSQKSSESASAPFILPGEMPMIVLSDCFLLPGCFLPLFIFEERYRLMLDHALRHDRMFCVGIRKSSQGDESSVLPVTTAGLVRACVRNPDGTSQLMLYGVKRITIKGWVQEKPFRIAKIEALETIGADDEQLEQLKQESLKLLPDPLDGSCESLKVVKKAAQCIPDPELLCDVLAYHFVRRPSVMKLIMAERSLVKRYELLIQELRASA